MVTAKDKLRTLLGNGLDYATGRAIAFSSEKADKATLEDNGIDDVLDVRRHAACRTSTAPICRNSSSPPASS